MPKEKQTTAITKKKVDIVPQIYVGTDKMDIAKTLANQIELLSIPTPEKYIMQRQGPGGLTLDYVETNYIIGRLNATFMFDWDTEIIEQIINKEENQIAMKVKLTVRFVNGKEIKKDAWGGSSIKRLKRDDSIMDLANDLKAAESDAIKKAASMLGIAWDVYAGVAGSEEIKEAEIVEDKPTRKITTNGKKKKEKIKSLIEEPDEPKPETKEQLPEEPGKGDPKKMTEEEMVEYYKQKVLADFEVRYGPKKKEAVFKSFKKFLFDFQKTRKPERKFVGINEFGHISMSEGAGKDVKIMWDNFVWTLQMWGEWEKEQAEAEEELGKNGIPF